MSSELTEDFRAIVLQLRPLIDVRAPVEFEKGAFPGAVNLPLMNDEERRLVGIRYKERGNSAAVALGHELVGGSVKAARVQAWQAFLKAHPDAWLYCFRGGQRSAISQQWLREAGITLPRLRGGYKAFRNFLMEASERISSEVRTRIIGGRTGSGKTLLLHGLDNAIDLEALARHRGSSFGRHITPQPSQIDFENALAYELIRHEAALHEHLVIEHESYRIGRVHLPKPIFENFHKGELVILETPFEARVAITLDEYVTQAQQRYEEHFGSEGVQLWLDDMLASLARIEKRLGNERFLHVRSVMQDAFDKQRQNVLLSHHESWIALLLREYYDPMYDYQIATTKIPVIFRGNAAEVTAFLKAR